MSCEPLVVDADPDAGLRQHILSVARAILERTDVAHLSMRQLIREAGLSNVAVYRAFGSKDMILREILRQEVEDFRRQAERIKTPDAFEFLFKAITLSTELFFGAPFMRTASTCLFSTTGVLQTSVDDIGADLWRSILIRLSDAGMLKPDADLTILAQHFLSSHIAAVRLQLVENLPRPLFEAHFGYGVALACCAFATPSAHDRFYRKIKAFEAVMAAG